MHHPDSTFLSYADAVKIPPKKVLSQTKTLDKEPIFIPQKSYFTALGTLPSHSIMASSALSSSSTSKHLSSSSQSDFSYGPVINYVFTIEKPIMKKFPDMNPIAIVNDHLPKTHFYIPDNFNKSHAYYESILVHTKSASFTYTKNKDEIPLYCKVLLLRVLTLDDWGQAPGLAKDFSLQSNGPKQRFNYWDYIDAWNRAFYLQNPLHTLSIFFHFGYEFTYPVPIWFLYWWHTFSFKPENAPLEIEKAFKKFEAQMKPIEPFDEVPPWLLFSQNFKVPWILMTEFKIVDEKQAHIVYPTICRFYKTKWWAKTDLSNCNEVAVDKFFQKNPSLSKFSTKITKSIQKSSLNEKRNALIAQLNACKDIEEMEALLQQISDIKSVSDSESDIHPAAGIYFDDTQPY